MRNIGDIVTIKSDLVASRCYGVDSVTEDMIQFCGAQAMVKDLEDGEYLLDIDEGSWYWTDEMLEN